MKVFVSTRIGFALLIAFATVFLNFPRALSGPTSSSTDLKSEIKTHAGTTFEVVRLNPKNVELKLYWKKSDGRPYANLADVRSDLKSKGRKFLMATNSGIYDTSYRPLGLHVERGREIRKINKSKSPGGNFSMVPNGVFLLSANGARVVDSTEYSSVRKSSKIIEATQSGPLLVRNGKIHPSFTPGSMNRKLRSGVGVTPEGEVHFAISNGLVSFYDFADFFKTQLGCPDALYLDGSISTLLVGERDPAPQAEAFVGIWAAVAK